MDHLSVHRLRPIHPSWCLGRGAKDACYTTLKGLSMMRVTERKLSPLGVDFNDTFATQHSPDNGKTWSEPEYIFPFERVGESVIAYNNLNFFLDPDNGLLLRFYQRQLQRPADKGTVRFIAHWAHMFLQISRDAGKTWEAPQQVIQKGAEYDFFHWARDTVIGRNGGMFCWGHMRKLADGTIFFPWFGFPVDEKGEIYNPFSSLGAYSFQRVGVFLGRWRADLSGIDWDLSDWITVSPEQSTRGVCEPATIVLDDGRIAMIMRGSNAGAPALPGVKWLSVSRDGGWTWSQCKPLTYDDGALVYSPANGSKIFQSTKNGRIYWLSVINDQNPNGNHPRYPLRVAEIDPQSLSVIRETVTLVETRADDEPINAQVSGNESWEDRVTKNIICIPRGNVPDGLTDRDYLYEIVIPDR